MLNALRLIDGVPAVDFAERTGLPAESIAPARQACVARGWLVDDPTVLRTTALGQRFLNDVIEAFMA
jgi:oxygen-independent coproporphyrinogen-3 oxidase